MIWCENAGTEMKFSDQPSGKSTCFCRERIWVTTRLLSPTIRDWRRRKTERYEYSCDGALTLRTEALNYFRLKIHEQLRDVRMGVYKEDTSKATHTFKIFWRRCSCLLRLPTNNSNTRNGNTQLGGGRPIVTSCRLAFKSFSHQRLTHKLVMITLVTFMITISTMLHLYPWCLFKSKWKMFIFIYITCDINYDSAQSRWSISISENMSNRNINALLFRAKKFINF